MGHSVSRASSTRSGVVGSRGSAGGIRRLAPTAPIPPLALLRRKARIPGLGHGRAKDIQHTRVLALAGKAAQLFVHTLRVLAGQVRHALYAQHLEIADHGRANRDQVLETALLGKHRKFSLTALAGILY